MDDQENKVSSPEILFTNGNNNKVEVFASKEKKHSGKLELYAKDSTKALYRVNLE